MTRRGRGVIACAVALAGLSVPSLASAEIARPPGANPSNRGFELVSFPDSKGIPAFLGVPRSNTSLSRPPALTRSGSAAFVTTFLPIDGLPDTTGAASFRSARTASGAWTLNDVNLPQRRHDFDDLDVPVDWTPNLTSFLYATSSTAVDPSDPSPVTNNGAPTSLLLQPLGGAPREQFNGATYTDDPNSAFGTPISTLSTDGRTVTFWKSFASFTAGTPLSSVYQRTDNGPIRLVSLDANDTPAQNVTFERASDDGSKIAFTADATSGGGRRLYLRDGATTYAIDRGAPAPAAPRTETRLVDATPDLSTIFFVTRDRLLASDQDDDADLYRWTENASGGDVALVSRGTGGGGNGSGADCPANLPSVQLGSSPQGCDVAYLGSSPDGNLTYFLSPEQLDGATGATPGEANVYVRRGDGAIRYALTVDAAEGVALYRGQTVPPPGDFTVEDDGTLLVHTARNPSAGPAFTTPQVVRVDPDTAAAACISCTAGGGSATEGQLAVIPDVNAGAPYTNATSDGRHVFFNTAARFVTEDRNSGTDVYDYDVATGTRSLVSSAGSGVTASWFAGVSADGADVLIATTDSLVARDRNGPILKVYDARSGGGEDRPVSSPLVTCGDDGCRPPATGAPALANPESSVLGTSRGNVKQTPAVRLSVGAVSAAQRRALAKTGELTLKVRTSAAATVRVKARARVGRRTVTVATGSVRLRRAGSGRVTLRLTANARRELRSKGTLRVLATASVTGGAAPKTLTLSLRATSNAKAGAR